MGSAATCTDQEGTLRRGECSSQDGIRLWPGRAIDDQGRRTVGRAVVPVEVIGFSRVPQASTGSSASMTRKRPAASGE